MGSPKDRPMRQLGDYAQAYHWLVQAMVLKEQCYSNHPEFTYFREDPRAGVGTNLEAASIVTWSPASDGIEQSG
jgi:hypothetical protein